MFLTLNIEDCIVFWSFFSSTRRYINFPTLNIILGRSVLKEKLKKKIREKVCFNEYLLFIIYGFKAEMNEKKTLKAGELKKKKKNGFQQCHQKFFCLFFCNKYVKLKLNSLIKRLKDVQFMGRTLETRYEF